MATILQRTTFPQHGTAQVTWSGLAAAGDVGAPETLGRYPQKSVTVSGTFAGAASVTIQGQDDPALPPAGWRTLLIETAAGDAAATFTAAGGGQIVDQPQFIRPNLTAGAAATVNVVIFAKTFGN